MKKIILLFLTSFFLYSKAHSQSPINFQISELSLDKDTVPNFGILKVSFNVKNVSEGDKIFNFTPIIFNDSLSVDLLIKVKGGHHFSIKKDSSQNVNISIYFDGGTAPKIKEGKYFLKIKAHNNDSLGGINRKELVILNIKKVKYNITMNPVINPATIVQDSTFTVTNLIGNFGHKNLKDARLTYHLLKDTASQPFLYPAWPFFYDGDIFGHKVDLNFGEEISYSNSYFQNIPAPGMYYFVAILSETYDVFSNVYKEDIITKVIFPVEIVEGKSGPVLGTLDNAGKDLQYLVFPNPSLDHISITSSDKDIKVVNVLSSTGSLLSTFNDSFQNVNVSNLMHGFYTLQIVTDNKIVYQKFMKE